MLALAWPELEILAVCEDGSEALEAIARLQPDVAFLDIRMPEMNGLDVARASNGTCNVVFTTAYDNHAIDAFELGAIDYLLKPVSQERLEQSIARLKEKMQAAPNPADLIKVMSELDQRLRSTEKAERIRWISSTVGSAIKIFPIEEVLFFEADARYTRVVSATDEAFIRVSIRELQKGLAPHDFWQIHRGTLVNVKAIARARRDEMGNLLVELREHPQTLKVSQTYAWRFRGELGFG
jgi:DNA-binding LytR/AlgR family response regulator